ncbi:MAG: hypothetical protein MJZ05_12745 [Fibrobacter sp.]|nr:hypothetical protein [Fibrobacter sp.]
MKKFLFTTLAVGALAVSAGATVSATSAADMENLKNSAGCYEISTRENLVGFANIVNGADGYTRNVSACGVLTKDIYYNENVVNSGKNGLNGSGYEEWTPIAAQSIVGNDVGAKAFKGTFDGQNHAVYGLYVTQQGWEPSFIGNAQGGAVVQNLNIKDSYFAPTGGGAGAIIGSSKSATGNTAVIKIDNCSFDGYINGGSTENNGGLVGSVASNTTINISNSYNEGRVVGKNDIAGLVAMVYKNGTVNLSNCYNAGYVDASSSNNSSRENQIVANKAGSASGTNIGCVSSGSGTSNCGNAGSPTKADSATTALNYLNNKSGASDIQSEWNKLSNDEKIKRLTENVEGIEVDTVWSTTKQLWITRTTIKTQLDLSENNALIIKEDVVADSITFDRDFKSGVASTIMVPFNYSVGSTMKAKFYEFANVSQDADGAWKVSAKQVSVLQAHTPYLIVPAADGELTFVGPFVLWANNNGGAYEKSIGNTAWKAVGVYTKKRWDVGVNEEEIGTIYGFAAQAKSEKNPGDFVRGGKKVAILPLRSYLKYDASTDEETVVSAPALTKMRAISSTEVASIDALPQRLVVELEDAPERVEIIESIDVPENPDGEDLGEKPQGIVDPALRLDVQKADRWFNINGRNMKNKPKSQGAFIKNSTPVIIK